ncbi:hypothetical protein Taro_051634 [Colocasia esculenta]|uniref:Uncharacterized protein n=1 Tax=Colocasia esculenta TaxID=4460 RepID=A0A843XHW1_COLES|nr:hypothetical protein [Colocasia esculenta]
MQKSQVATYPSKGRDGTVQNATGSFEDRDRQAECDDNPCHVQNMTEGAVATSLRTRPIGPSRSQVLHLSPSGKRTALRIAV